jgi:hypothetical protein
VVRENLELAIAIPECIRDGLEIRQHAAPIPALPVCSLHKLPRCGQPPPRRRRCLCPKRRHRGHQPTGLITLVTSCRPDPYCYSCSCDGTRDAGGPNPTSRPRRRTFPIRMPIVRHALQADDRLTVEIPSAIITDLFGPKSIRKPWLTAIVIAVSLISPDPGPGADEAHPLPHAAPPVGCPILNPRKAPQRRPAVSDQRYAGDHHEAGNHIHSPRPRVCAPRTTPHASANRTASTRLERQPLPPLAGSACVAPGGSMEEGGIYEQLLSSVLRAISMTLGHLPLPARNTTKPHLTAR